MSQTLLNPGNSMDGTNTGGNMPTISPASGTSASASSTGSSTASSPNASGSAILPPASKLFPALLFGASAAMRSQMLNGQNGISAGTGPSVIANANATQSMLHHSASSSSFLDHHSPTPPPKQRQQQQPSAEAISGDPLARQRNHPQASQAFAQQQQMQQQQLSPTTMTERMALTAALMQFMASANAVPNGGNPLEGGGGGGTANGHMSAAGAGMQSAAAAAFLPLFSSGLYPCWPFSPAAFGTPHFPATNFGADFMGQMENLAHQYGFMGGGGPFASSTPTSPSAPMPSLNLDFQQQLALAWQSQMVAALGFLGSFNGFCQPPTSTNPNRSTTDQQQHLTNSEDEALAFLLGQRRQKTTANANQWEGQKAKKEDDQEEDGEEDEEEEPLDLRAKSSPKDGKGSATDLAQGKPRGTKRPASDEKSPKDAVENGKVAPRLIKNVSSDSLQAMDEEAEPDGNLLEDGSEAESPKLGIKKSYTQADLDAAVLDIRLGRLGTRRASVVYGIPRSTLRNKIYKLEAAEDVNGDRTEPKRRRLNAYALHKREKQRLSASATAVTQKIDESNGDELAESPMDEDEEAMEKSNTINNGMMMPEGGGVETMMRRKNDDGSPMNGIINHQQNVPLPMPECFNAEKIWKQLSGQLGQFVGQFQQQHQQLQQQQKKKSASFATSTNPHQTEHPNLLSEAASSRQEKPSAGMDLNAVKKEGSREQQQIDKNQRPKRGQYRKYDKDDLDKAVAAVRAGEMSVHRAGSHFGVPHSTLEYKVKERNLLRTKSKKALLKFHSSNSLPTSTFSTNQNAAHLAKNVKLKAEMVEEPAESQVTMEVRNAIGSMLESICNDDGKL